MARLRRDATVTEKIDGTNAQAIITASAEDPRFVANHGRFWVYAGSRNRLITPDDDNHGFAKWVLEHADELVEGLGVGRHFGEWWGSGINRGYGLPNGEKRFSLFNTYRWCPSDSIPETVGHKWDDANKREVPVVTTPCPSCCHVVPVLYRGIFNTAAVERAIEFLRRNGSVAAQGYMNPEGVVVFHSAGNVGFKQTLSCDDSPKGRA